MPYVFNPFTGTFDFTNAAGAGGPPSGPASGDLSGRYPGPSVIKINGVAYNADPLAQYWLLAGRAGGQIGAGGTGVGENLGLNSTTNATPGTINLQPNVATTPASGWPVLSFDQNLSIPATTNTGVIVLDVG